MAVNYTVQTDFQDSGDTKVLMESINSTFPLLYPGYTIDINQSAPIKESASGQTGCAWYAVLTSGQYPQADQVELSPADPAPDNNAPASGTPDQSLVVAKCETLMQTFVSSDYFNSHPEAVRGQTGSMPYSVPPAHPKNLPSV